MYEHGYEAMSLRELARAVGLRPGSLYNHYRTKQELLLAILRQHMQELIAAAEAHLATLAPSAGPRDKVAAFIDFHLRYYVAKKRDVFVANMELRALNARNYATIVAYRRRYEALLVAMIEEGIRLGAFAPTDAKVAAYGIFNLLTGVCFWFKRRGRLSVDQLVAVYTGLVFGGLQGEAAAG
jgi:AcrR family transcriptional regulator